MIMIAKQDGHCEECGQVIFEGDEIEWSQSAGARHPQCARRACDWEIKNADRKKIQNEKSK